MNKKKSKGTQGRDALGAAIKRARQAKGLSQSAVGRQLGMTRQGYAHYELGTSLPPAGDLPKLCEILNLDPSIFGKSGLAVAKLPPTDDPLLLHLHQLWGSLDPHDRRVVIETAEGRLAMRGIQIQGFYQPRRNSRFGTGT